MFRSLTRRQLIFLFITLLMLVALAWLLREFVSLMVLQPLINLGWMAWIGVMSLHQALIWGVFLLVALMILLGGIFASPARRRRPRVDSGDESPAQDESQDLAFNYRRGVLLPRFGSPSRYHFWKSNLDALSHSPFARERVVRELQLLVTRVLADQQRASPEEIKARLSHGELELEPAVATLFRLQRGYWGIDDRHWWQKLFRRPSQMATPRLDVEALAGWLEEQIGTSPQGIGDKIGNYSEYH